MRKAGLYWLMLAVAVTACVQKSKFVKLEDGVTIHLTEAGVGKPEAIRLQVISDKIIHVVSSPSDSFSTAKSLITLPDLKGSSDWKLVEEKDQLILATKQLKAKVSLTTGEVVFTDTTGQVILQEKQGGGKTLTPIEVDNEKMYTLRQVFESPADEAFYGLGQHQEGQMNYKGKDVSLFQYNTKVAVPFLVSNKNYGILWDNYSLTRFGDQREYNSLSLLTLYNKEGKKGGLSADYVSKKNPSEIFLTREDTVINYESLTDQKRFPKEFPLANGLVNWTGSVESKEEGKNHKFLLYYAGYIKVWLNDQLVADHWRQAWNPGSVGFELAMEKGKKYPIKIEWYPDGGESYLSLKWQHAPEEEQNRLSLFSEAGDQIDYYFIAGKNMDEVISGYRAITGKAELYPKWALGFWQSRERYKTQKEILDVAAEFRKRKIPIDNIVLDWSYWKVDQWGSQEFDPERFPDATAMIRKLHDMNLHFMISAWPKFYEGVENYKAFDAKGWLYKQNIVNRQRDWIGKGYVSTFYDPYNEEARNAFWELLHKNLHSKGVDAWWMDATEPDILSNASLQERKKLMNPTALGSSTKYFNAFPLMNEKGIYEGLKKADPDKRVFILTRSAFAGSQRYAAATWSGDIGANWQDFKTQIPAGLNFSLSGIPYWTTDIGGFSVERKFEHAQGEELEEWRERMTRWFQFGAFSPLFRAHGQYPFREMFNVAPDNHPAYKTMLYYDQLRYRLLPYIYSLSGKVYFDDYTIMRALVMDFGSDKKVLNIGNEFMYGPSILVAPVTQHKARTWDVYLPASTGWYDFHTGKYFEGGQNIKADAPLEQMPLFVKAGAIIPAGPELQYTSEKKADPLTLYVYTGANGSFDLYEDEGLNNDYQKEQYSIIPFSYDEASKTLKIGQRKGSFQGMLENRTIEIVWISKEQPVGLNLSAKPQHVVKYDGKEVSVKM